MCDTPTTFQGIHYNRISSESNISLVHAAMTDMLSSDLMGDHVEMQLTVFQCLVNLPENML